MLDPVVEPVAVSPAASVVEPLAMLDLVPPAAPPAPVALPEPAPTPEPVAAAAPAPASTAPLADAPAAAALAAAHAPTLLLAPEDDPARTPAPVRTRSRSRAGDGTRHRVNALAVVALVLGLLASPLAALFGHLALSQVTASRERGRIPAIIAIVLGYGSLAFIVGLGVVYLVGHA